MKRAFIIAKNGRLTSAVVRGNATKNTLSIGDRIIITKDIEIGSGVKIGAGARGTVDYIKPVWGFTEILMDDRYKCLDRWDNHFWLEPFDTDELLGSVAHIANAEDALKRAGYYGRQNARRAPERTNAL